MRLLTLVLGLLASVATAAADAPRDLAGYVVLGVHGVDLGDETFVANGNVGVNLSGGELRIGEIVFLPTGSAAVADHVTVGENASLFDVFTNDLESAPPITIRGAGPTAFAPLIAAIPPLPKFAPGSTFVFVQAGLTRTLAPGAYGAAVVDDDATLELTGGHYEFTVLDVGSYGSVVADAPVVVNVRSSVEVGAFGSVGPANGDLAAGDVHVNVGGGFVRVEQTAHLAMDLLAPKAQVRFGRSVRAEGRFVGDQFQGDETINLRLVGPADGPAPSQLCTLTQEDYGAPLDGAPGPAASIAPLTLPLPVTIGAPGVSSLTVSDAARLLCLLPARGIPASLCLRLPGCAGDTLVDACDNPPILDFDPTGDGASGGLGGGGLAGQVIAAKLNVARSRQGTTPPGLERFVLPSRLCTTACPQGRVVNPNPMRFQTDAVGVADGITTVGGLIAFADQVLGETHCRPGTCVATSRKAALPPNPIRLSDVETALRAVNECFRGCAAVIPCGS